jgi:Clp amino terminal domain, pathogenicity island component
MELNDLIQDVERRAPSTDPLDRLSAAVLQHEELAAQADQLLDHFVHEAREAGCSWTQIGEVLGVTKQAAQQRHGAGGGGWLSWLFGTKGGRSGGRLFTRFTDRARNSVTEAQVAARELGHDRIGTEHVLIGLFSEPESIAAKLLAAWSVTRDDVVHEVETRVGRCEGAPKGHIPFTPQAKNVLKLTLDQALGLGHNYIGTEHILLGLLAADDGLAAQILTDRGVTLPQARYAIVEALGNLPRRSD